MVQSAYDDFNTGISSVRSIGIDDAGDNIQQVDLLGAGTGEIYVGPQQIVLYAMESTYGGYGMFFDYLAPINSVITRISYDNSTGALGSVQRGTVAGTPTQGQWAFKELDTNTTAVVTTSWSPLVEVDGPFTDHEVGKNHLFLLQGNEDSLNTVSGNINFGKPHEDVRSVRYIDQHVYVVTFEKTDPLYSFNLSDPLAPVMEDALEIPGFRPICILWERGE